MILIINKFTSRFHASHHGKYFIVELGQDGGVNLQVGDLDARHGVGEAALGLNEQIQQISRVILTEPSLTKQNQLVSASCIIMSHLHVVQVGRLHITLVRVEQSKLEIGIVAELTLELIKVDVAIVVGLALMKMIVSTWRN